MLRMLMLVMVLAPVVAVAGQAGVNDFTWYVLRYNPATGGRSCLPLETVLPGALTPGEALGTSQAREAVRSPTSRLSLTEDGTAARITDARGLLPPLVMIRGLARCQRMRL